MQKRLSSSSARECTTAEKETRSARNPFAAASINKRLRSHFCTRGQAQAVHQRRRGRHLHAPSIIRVITAATCLRFLPVIWGIWQSKRVFAPSKRVTRLGAVTNGVESGGGEEERFELREGFSGRTTSKTTMRLAAWDCGINFNSFKETVILRG